ncbi:uncharacterized protein A4U43_C05F19980 [Asparagus officinalis]|uniref:Uncharacterized protein n=1 Tax=Asparagus officinalis TaxID=4686 RepID=A0A5P1EXC0_ASPOF|nr:uncharacterized protein A4U43_C05F19980 [Asparagus officinalis]
MKRTGSVVAAVASRVLIRCPIMFWIRHRRSLSRCALPVDYFQGGRKCDDVDDQERRRSGPTDRFAPRFDGLRFIETLVTAHRPLRLLVMMRLD